MNDYYKKLKIGSDKVSNHLNEVKKELAGWSEEERQAAIISLQEDVSDSENMNLLFPMVSIVFNTFTTATKELDLSFLGQETVSCITFVVILFALLWCVVIWIEGKCHIHKYKGLLSLLENMEMENVSKKP